MPTKEEGQLSSRASRGVRLLRTKLFVPQAHADFVPRARLRQQLDQGQSCRLSLISAPAGFGKTTLLGDWVRQRDLNVAWVSLDAGDNDPIRFWTYVAAALGNVEAGLTETSSALLQSPQCPPLDVVLVELINEVAGVSSDLTLVLDDYHAIEASAIHATLGFLLDNMPPQLHLIIASRHDPPLPLARFRARRQLMELHEQDLRFTPEETAVFLNQTIGLGLSDEEIVALRGRTEGWAAGLQLAALSMQTEGNRADFLSAFGGSHRYVFDYLAQEVLQRQPESVRSFLLKTSVLDRLCGSLCDAVADTTDGNAKLERLEQANLFIVPLDQERRWYRFHHLFADFLRLQAEQEFGKVGVAALNQRASAWHAQHSFIEDAVRHSLAAGDYEGVATLIEEHAGKMFVGSELTTLVGWSRSLPDGLLRSRPKLSLILAWARLATGDTEGAERSVDAVERALGKTMEMLTVEQLKALAPEVRAALVEVSVIRSSLALSTFDTSRVLEIAQRALPYLEDGTQPYLYNEPRHLRPIVMFNMAVAYEVAGKVRAASNAFAEAATMGYEQGNLHIFPMALSHLAQLQIVEGRLRAAAETYRRALQLVGSIASQVSPLAGQAYTGMGQLLYEWNDLATALANLEHGIALGKKWSNWDALISGYVYLARVKEALGDRVAALDALTEIIGICRSAKLEMVLPTLEAARARFSLAEGDLDAATRWAESTGLSAESEIPYLREGEGLIFARVLFALGRLDEARELLERLLAAARAGHRMGRVVEILAVQAMVYDGQGQTSQALIALGEALTYAEPEGFIRVFVDEGAPMADLLRNAQANGIARDYVARLLAAFGTGGQATPNPSVRSIPESSTRLRSNQPPAEPLSDREGEVLRLIANGLTNEEIGEALFVSVNTVKTHLKNIYGKLGVRSRTQAIASARELGLL